MEGRAVQHHGQGRPECTEAQGQQTLRHGGAPQPGMLAPQGRQRSPQGAVRQLRRGHETRQSPRERDAQRHDGHGSRHEHRAPAELFGHETADHARQQDAQQQVDVAAGDGLERQLAQARPREHGPAS
ncbi:hypothetical protein G6F60_014250 [Rhizopus arrhizus]|nr:hypothetical protein G6F60_014250 [Rhizopus arrhizus]